ncbi:hypothetical protein KL930_001080 [Ogataea haglerorum]|uniref:RNA helicase n=1 Tax=Ogataea haglerorum TaxID=1937702 RepID=A0ABQ7RN85_9ASCO|nr:hypothetical protein KL915_001081 [Ogataea haglerorum]KAG7711865.1 hypothetical protein KL914_000507 [Ogataea haglerorum]KAG7712636.1 hypothetical protein KL950_000507 [Ogataea haglerorum]KAG7722686.1 hypothetical protein KL913_000506 [Ogataea haglerorum]KAG7723212.1 hypothetical protein KL949_000262 [Ogataea haglerorum]
MDIFRILSRGASLKKTKGVSVDFSLAQPAVKNSAEKENLETEIEREVDFFHQKDHKKKELAKPESEEEQPAFEPTVEPTRKVLTTEEALQLRKSYGAKVSGDDLHLPIGSFEDLVTRFKLNKQLLDNLISNGFTEPTPIQCEAIPACLADRDLICCAPTGSGKTLAFLIPMVQRLGKGRKNHGVRGLVISPTKELAAQIFSELTKLCKGSSLQIGFLNKSIAAKLRNRVLLSSKFDILVSTPLRLIDLIGEEVMDLSKVEEVVFDEVDKLFESKFVEQTDRILTACSNPKLRRSIFSATITSSVEELANSIMNSPIRIIIGHKEAANSNIEQKLVFCGNEHGKLLALREMLRKGEFKPPVIIFLQSITRAKALFHELLYDRLNVDVIHAERTQLQRETIIDRFRKGELWCLICTDVLARGIDFKGINLVINYDVPTSAQAYVHRIGRTGRGGRSGKAVTFYTKEDTLAIKPIVNVMKQSGWEDGMAGWLKNDLSKLTKREKKQIKQKAVDRKPISTVPAVVRKKRKQRKEMIEASKKRKLLEQSSNN